MYLGSRGIGRRGTIVAMIKRERAIQSDHSLSVSATSEARENHRVEDKRVLTRQILIQKISSAALIIYIYILFKLIVLFILGDLFIHLFNSYINLFIF